MDSSAGSLRQGLAATTLIRPVARGGTTLALLRPLRCVEGGAAQQLLLHCAAAGCPVLGDRHRGWMVVGCW